MSYFGTPAAPGAVSSPTRMQVLPRSRHAWSLVATDAEIKVDLSALLDQAFGSGQKAADLVQVTHDANGTSSTLAVDVQGTNTPNQYVSLAHLDNVHAGDVVTAILDHAQYTAQLHVG